MLSLNCGGGCGSMWSDVNMAKRKISPASVGQMNTINSLYDELGMDPDDIKPDMTSLEAHQAINELLTMKREM